MSRLLAVAVLVVAGLTWAQKAAPKGKKPATPAAAAAPVAPAPEVPTQEARTQNVVEVAVGSADHTTLVAGLKAAEYVVSLTNAGPFTVFAPTNAGFDKLPKGTLDTLLKPENKEQLQNILKYHVAVSVYELKNLKDGMKLGMANGANVVFKVVDGKVKVNDATIVATVRTSNGNIHVIDSVLLPPPKTP
jgi:uncharacterized surface protein with fasciclin (FAS1) repeats